jgi:hypothetical protein
MGGVCGMLGRREKNVQGFCRKIRRKETTRKTGVDGRMGCCKCGDEPSGSGPTEIVIDFTLSYRFANILTPWNWAVLGQAIVIEPDKKFM